MKLWNLLMSNAYAETAAAGEAAVEGSASVLSMIISMLPMVLIIVVFYFMLIRPQRKKDKKVKEMLNALKPGDRVRTIGGIYGTISSVKDDVVVLTVGPDKLKLVFARGAISQVEDAGVENTMTEEVK